MNAVEIEAAVSELTSQPFDASEFPYQFLAAFDKKETQLKRLKKGDTNRSDMPGGVLLQANIHMAVCPPGATRATMERLKASPRTAAGKAKFILATDGLILEAEDLATGDAIAPDYQRFADHIGFFLPLAGISTVREIKDNPIDVRATGRLNKLYVELLRQNPDWGTEARRHDMNHFMARLIFCFFAEDTDIFHSRGLFTGTIEQWSESDGSNTHHVIEACFRAMNTKIADREARNVPSWANTFPYVNGGLFAGSTDVPRFTRIARSYLLQAGSLDWQHINPDIFGSMIQAVADEEERGALGMHYTSVPNILKVLNPLFLDDLRAQLEAAGDNGRMLLNLRRRISRIRVFDPACGSGNFLVIAYKEMRKIEAEINRRRGEHLNATAISKKNFRGIELRDFAAEIARLSLVIAEYQCDVLYRGLLAAKEEFLPLDEMNWITCGNALRLDWLNVCPPEGTQVRVREAGKLQFDVPEAKEIGFENEGGETYVCGNPPFSGFNAQTPAQQSDLRAALSFTSDYKYFDYVSGWFAKAAQHLDFYDSCAFVATNSIVQGLQVPILWRPIFSLGIEIFLAHETFVWKNNAANNAGVFCVIIGLSKQKREKFIWGDGFCKRANNINGYLADAPSIFVDRRQDPLSELPPMSTGNVAYDGGNLIISEAERKQYLNLSPGLDRFIRPLIGSKEFIRGEHRYCIWIPKEEHLDETARQAFANRFERVRRSRLGGGKIASNYAHVPYRFYMTNESSSNQILVPRVASARRDYFPVGFIDNRYVISDSAQAVFDAPLWVLALTLSKTHLVWVNTVSGKLKGDLRYSAIICYNTFPVPSLTEQNKADLTRCAEDILVAREAHFPATIADLYDPEAMPENLRAAHDANDEVLERIYIGRRFRNDTERLEKLFEMYTKMTTKDGAAPKSAKRCRKITA